MGNNLDTNEHSSSHMREQLAVGFIKLPSNHPIPNVLHFSYLKTYGEVFDKKSIHTVLWRKLVAIIEKVSRITLREKLRAETQRNDLAS